MSEIIVPPDAERLLEVFRTRPGALPENRVVLESGLDSAICAAQIPVLRALEYDILRLANGSYQLISTPDRLLPNEISHFLQTKGFGRSLHCFEEVDSTNTVAAELARGGAPEGTVVLAESQTRGRGRLGRAWVSPPRRNLYLSLVLRPTIPADHLPQISLMAGLAACEAVSAWCPAKIKWPNDVLVSDRKVAGILTELEMTGGDGAAPVLIVGIGVNLNIALDEFPAELQDKAGSLRASTGKPVPRCRFTAVLLNALERRYDELCNSGFAPIRFAWHEHTAMLNRRITVQAPEGTIDGIALGLDDFGALRIQKDSGIEERVLAGDVTVVGGYSKGE